MSTNEHISSKPLQTPKLSSGEMVELNKPIIFGNHQKHFKLFTWAVGIGIVYYMVFRHDFGAEDHCFSKIRAWKDAQVRQFFSVDKDRVNKIKQERTRIDSHHKSEGR